MQVRNLWFLPLSVYTDEALKLSYLKILTFEKFETVKLPTYLSEYRYQHLMNATNLIFTEVIKTKKNWILKNILQTELVVNANEYTDYLKFSEISGVILEFFQEESEVNILNFILTTFKQDTISNINIAEFKRSLETLLGFK